MPDLFFSKIFKLGVYIVRTSSCTNSIVITPKDLSGIWENWINDRVLLHKDRVHLTRKGVKAAGDLIKKAVLYWGDYKNLPVTNPAHTIPKGIPYSR